MSGAGGTIRQDASVDARLAAIVESSYDAIIGKDLNSIITDWNQAAERVFGYSAEEAIGQSILMLIPEHMHHEETDIIARIRRGERIPSFETTRRRKDGSLISVSLTISPIKNSAGGIVGASQIARDISAAKESERRIRLLMREVNHRVKNQFAVILSMVRETSKRSTDPAEFEHMIRARIMALSRSHDLLVTSEWAGASLFDLVQEHLKPFGHEERISLSGPLLTLQSNAVQNLGMAFHELGTNSSKYGALAVEGGHVEITWKVETGPDARRRFHLLWYETSRAPAVETAPKTAERKESGERKGFGTVVLQRVAPQSLSGSSTLERSPGSLKWTLDAPLEAIVVPQLGADAEGDFSV
ncbi:PAS domain S-box protein [Mesorhizobium sp. M2D.F.Ca.ET.185.01.1.1]|uniref:sensor histidine kinase n=1 Tax=unclassified Mesorhizobium TaxID=325217 RepID=UPI000FCCD6AA|nr:MULTISPECIES: PAS domain S-box protein [unclassified Mesorhizobium]TGP49660.1 PAS domain S-box protein [bacterium M00.F.Ca.ET.230.01.1.1]TGP74783.1 PAS domain S-box protein [bacterium M00.F.Ca.ET.227.01.1.1]TGP84678.1 PAS domain S-box protein [bacterium M00.F.Ca.ET.221.01.1.1]TGP87737.1 PAS domain S-box protein [bacterium M00.F.Ca.ET.222.01.1.1]TGT70985.1 PAS domain S-box protein [bacterium M00.F.Ca.ET.159.01.1.1]TGT82628.1 PAS domain S-box protein [bacterium M00.F.Ca.ET.157.01.1.1]TGT971